MPTGYRSPTAARGPKRTSPPLDELAEDWLTAKRALESAAQADKGNSDRARRGDLTRWAHLLAGVLGRLDDDHLDPDALLGRLQVRDLSTETVTAAIAEAKTRWSQATVARMTSTLRGFTGWLHRTGRLPRDPMGDELLRVRVDGQRRPRALSDDDLESLVAAAARPHNERSRLWWPTRDVALVRFLAGSGARAEELCGVTIGEIDRRPERPIWRVNRSKGAKQRDVPLGRATMEALDAWLTERGIGGGAGRALPARRVDGLFVRVDGQAFTVNVLDRLLRRLADRAGVSFPAGAAAHAFRHHYGVTLAMRGVPQAAIAQLMGHADPRSTSIYTTVASQHLIGVLDDAGLL